MADGKEVPDPESEFEDHFDRVDDEDVLASRRLTVGDLGTLSQRIGPEAARAFVRAESLTYHTRVEAARRLGPAALR
jgi:hypothetical protein